MHFPAFGLDGEVLARAIPDARAGSSIRVHGACSLIPYGRTPDECIHSRQPPRAQRPTARRPGEGAERGGPLPSPLHRLRHCEENTGDPRRDIVAASSMLNAPVAIGTDGCVVGIATGD
jgi:hypothetical protein